MPRFAANIQLMFKEYPFLDRFAAAKRAGFKAVECQSPYAHSIDDLKRAITPTGLEFVLINTRPGDPAVDGFGLGAMPGFETEFQARVDQALDDAEALSVPEIHATLTRLNHWLTAACFVLLTLSGLAMFDPVLFWLSNLFGGGQSTRAIHPWIGIVLTVSYAGLVVQFFRDNMWSRDDIAWLKKIDRVLANDEEGVPEVARFNAGQKFVFWSMTFLIPVLLLIAGWSWYARNTPRDHPGVLPAELAEIGDRAGEQIHRQPVLARLATVLSSRHVPLLFLSYLCMNYTFYLLANWVFLYLVQQRHFSVLESSWLASVPPLAAAAGAGLGGWLTGRACRKCGARWGYRLGPVLALPSAALLLLVAVNTDKAYLAVILLALCYGLVELTEGSYWGGAMNIGRGDSMMVCGVMNTGGNLGGIIGIPLVAYWSGHHRWDVAIWIGVALALLSAIAWLAINADAGRRETAEPIHG